ncbi:MAG TPA: 2OG-Fe(II) oxygenase [Alphaproteobacteria bacterium]|nr:2OG-Fe(II) oxygenase [Alphaproteobacteria bacterium]
MTTSLDLDALAATPLRKEPYDYVVVPNFVRAAAFEEIVADYPQIGRTGSYPPSELHYGRRFASFLAELEGPEFRRAVEQKFALSLDGRPTMITVRGRTGGGDGYIHTDTATKIITVLIYFNRGWEADGGRLRILRGPNDLADYAEEVSPYGGTLLAFRRSETSWHGHEKFDGQRRAIQLNWVTDMSVVNRELARHRVSAFFKKLNPFAA